MDIKEWLKEARRRKGWTQEQLGEIVGVTKGNVSGWENGRHEPSFQQLNRISLASGLPLDVGSAPLIASEPTMQPILSWQHESDLPAGDFVLIPRLDFHLSAGTGKDQVELQFVDKQPQAFRADWIRSERLKPSKLACMTASGRSMEPSIWDGDSLVVDVSQTEVVDGNVYALWYEGGERVKRLFRLPGGGLRIKSDNPEYDTIDLTAEYSGQVRVIGRVVHRSGKGGL
jgi:phage repressor protein C with HTH and peptisase S24 domain